MEKSGAWFSYDSQRLGQGRENAKLFLKDNPDIAAAIEQAIRQNAGLIAEPASTAAPRTKRRRAEASDLAPAARALASPRISGAARTSEDGLRDKA